MVAAAFADEGVVKLLTRKMQLCKEAQRAILCREGEEAAARGGGAAAAAAAAAEGAGKESGAPFSSPIAATTNTRRCSPPGGAGQEKSNDIEIVGGEKAKSPSARSLEEQNAPGFPRGHVCGPSAGPESAQRRLHARGRDDEPRTLLSLAAMPMFAIDPGTMPDAIAAVTVPMGLGEDAGEHTPPTARTIDGWGDGCLERQGRQVTTTARASEAGGVDADRHVDATVEKGGGGYGPDQYQECSPLLGTGRDDRPSPSFGDLGSSNGPGALARKQQPDGDQPHRGGTGDGPPTVVGEANNEIRVGEGREPSAAPSGNAHCPSPTGVLVERQFDGVEDDRELGLILSSFEQKMELGAGLVRGCEEPNDDGETEEGNDQPEIGRAEAVSFSSSCSEESHFAGSNNNGSAVPELGQREATPVAIPEVAVGIHAAFGSPKIFASDVDRESGEPTRNSKTECVLSPEKDNSANRKIFPDEGERKLSPEVATTEDEDNEDYDFTFDDDELVPDHKTVQFTDESRWSVHEVRESFQQHELGELFYTTAELDVMQEEAELEEALERSKYIASQREDALDKGGGGLLLSLGGKSAQKREASGGDVETASSESLSFDYEGSEYSF